ncbi:MAG: hypothetical protein A2Z59_01325 [Nitrospinae bacterium RIFCSPLOWO2_02_39_17]|nr:MAG: hypothetical protein A2Z59_01325 [Nitrospinae bacterium RIFCSPLOWO2_02_39_17]
MTAKAIRVYEIFKELGLEEKKAEEVVELLTETAREGLATKEDIYRLELKIEKETANLKIDMIKWMVGLLLGQTALTLTVIRLFFIK